MGSLMGLEKVWGKKNKDNQAIPGFLSWKCRRFAVQSGCAVWKHPLMLLCPSPPPPHVGGAAEPGGGRGQGQCGVPLPAVPVLCAVQRVSGAQEPAGRDPHPPQHHPNGPPPPAGAHGGGCVSGSVCVCLCGCVGLSVGVWGSLGLWLCICMTGYACLDVG